MKKTLLLSLIAVAGVAAAQQTGFYSDGRPMRLFRPVSGLDNRDIKFVKQAQASNDFEIESSKLALVNGDSSFVKAFANRMIKDHSSAEDEVSQLAQHKALTLSAALPDPLSHKLNLLRSLHGVAFDNAYLADQKAGHLQTINQFKAEIDRGHDQDVKAVAVKLLPTIEMHYKMLQTHRVIG